MRKIHLAALCIISALALLSGCKSTEEEIQLAPLEERIPEETLENLAKAYSLTPEQWAELRGVRAPFIDLTKYQEAEINEIPSDPLGSSEFGMTGDNDLTPLIEVTAPAQDVTIEVEPVFEIVTPDPQFASLLTDELMGEKNDIQLSQDEEKNPGQNDFDYNIAGVNNWTVHLADDEETSALISEGNASIIHDEPDSAQQEYVDPSVIREIYEYNEAIHNERLPLLSRILYYALAAVAVIVLLLITAFTSYYLFSTLSGNGKLKPGKKDKALKKDIPVDEEDVDEDAGRDSIAPAVIGENESSEEKDREAAIMKEIKERLEAEKKEETEKQEAPAASAVQDNEISCPVISSSREVLVNEPPYNMLAGA